MTSPDMHSHKKMADAEVELQQQQLLAAGKGMADAKETFAKELAAAVDSAKDEKRREIKKITAAADEREDELLVTISEQKDTIKRLNKEVRALNRAKSTPSQANADKLTTERDTARRRVKELETKLAASKAKHAKAAVESQVAAEEVQNSAKDDEVTRLRAANGRMQHQLHESQAEVLRLQAVLSSQTSEIQGLRTAKAAVEQRLTIAAQENAAGEQRLVLASEGKAAVQQRLAQVIEEKAAAAAQQADNLLQRLNEKDLVLKMEEDKRRAAELRFQADKQAKEAALAAAAEKRIVADMVRDAVARGAVKGADALAAAKEERAVAELVRGAVARGALKAADALAAQDHPAATAKGAIMQLHTQRSPPKDMTQQLQVLDPAALKDNKPTLAGIARLAVMWTGNTAASAASNPLLRPAVGSAGMLMRLPGVSSIMKTSMWTARSVVKRLAPGLVAM